MPDQKDTPGQRLKAFRKKKELSQGEFGRPAGVKQNMISGFEKDQKAPDRRSVLAIWAVWGFNPEYWLYGTEPETKWPGPDQSGSLAPELEELLAFLVQKPEWWPVFREIMQKAKHEGPAQLQKLKEMRDES